VIEQISDLQKFVTPVDIADFGARPSGIQIEGLHRQPRVHAYRDIDGGAASNHLPQRMGLKHPEQEHQLAATA
jgi:hypothetical protein